MWNVVKEDLSLVGTRPPAVEEFEKYEMHKHAILAIEPRLTRLWQVSGDNMYRSFKQA